VFMSTENVHILAQLQGWLKSIPLLFYTSCWDQLFTQGVKLPTPGKYVQPCLYMYAVITVINGPNRVVALGKLLTPLGFCHQTVFGMGQGAVMLFDWEGNRRPGGR